MGNIDRIQQLAQSAKLINAFQRVNPADQRQSQKKDQGNQDERSDTIELSQDELDEDSLVLVEPPIEPEDEGDDDHLDIAV